MILSPLAFFDLLERQAAEWLPPVAPDAAWVFERFMNLAENRADLRLSLHTSDRRALVVAMLRARGDEIGALQGLTRFGLEGVEVAWSVPFKPAEDLAWRALELAKGWQTQISALLPGPSSASAPAPGLPSA